MTMLGRRRRSSADKAGNEQVTTDQTDTEQTDETGQTDTVQNDAEQTDAELTDAATERAGTDQEADEPADAEDGPATSRAAHRSGRRAGRLRVRVRAGAPLLIVLAVVAALLGAAAAGLWIKRGELLATDEAAVQAVHAASQAARDLSSYDYRTLESDFKTASNQTTGTLHNEYDALAQQIRATAIQQQAVSQTTVIKAGVESAAPERVTALVYANRSATTTASPNRLPESLRIRMTMTKVSGRWLASDLQVL
jgi:hypothetical protein